MTEGLLACPALGLEAKWRPGLHRAPLLLAPHIIGSQDHSRSPLAPRDRSPTCRSAQRPTAFCPGAVCPPFGSRLGVPPAPSELVPRRSTWPRWLGQPFALENSNQRTSQNVFPALKTRTLASHTAIRTPAGEHDDPSACPAGKRSAPKLLSDGIGATSVPQRAHTVSEKSSRSFLPSLMLWPKPLVSGIVASPPPARPSALAHDPAKLFGSFPTRLPGPQIDA